MEVTALKEREQAAKAKADAMAQRAALEADAAAREKAVARRKKERTLHEALEQCQTQVRRADSPGGVPDGGPRRRRLRAADRGGGLVQGGSGRLTRRGGTRLA